MSINTSYGLYECLQRLGFNVKIQGEVLNLRISLDVKCEDPKIAAFVLKVPVVLSITDGVLEIDAGIYKLGDIDDHLREEFFITCLDLNSRIKPFAVALLSGTDDSAVVDEDEWPLILTTAFLVNDLSEEGVSYFMTTLESSLITCSRYLSFTSRDNLEDEDFKAVEVTDVVVTGEAVDEITGLGIVGPGNVDYEPSLTISNDNYDDGGA